MAWVKSDIIAVLLKFDYKLFLYTSSSVTLVSIFEIRVTLVSPDISGNSLVVSLSRSVALFISGSLCDEAELVAKALRSLLPGLPIKSTRPLRWSLGSVSPICLDSQAFLGFWRGVIGSSTRFMVLKLYIVLNSYLFRPRVLDSSDCSRKLTSGSSIIGTAYSLNP